MKNIFLGKENEDVGVSTELVKNNKISNQEEEEEEEAYEEVIYNVRQWNKVLGFCADDPSAPVCSKRETPGPHGRASIFLHMRKSNYVMGVEVGKWNTEEIVRQYLYATNIYH